MGVRRREIQRRQRVLPGREDEDERRRRRRVGEALLEVEGRRLDEGGAEVVRLARDRFEDATYAFESHHHNYARARAIIAKYEVSAPATRSLRARPAGGRWTRTATASSSRSRTCWTARGPGAPLWMPDVAAAAS